MSIKMKFIGQNGSLGLRYGQVYDVKIDVTENMVWVEWGNNRCPYSSIANFLSNWSSVD